MEAKIAMRAASLRMKRYYDKTHRSVEFRIGDRVLLSSKNLRIKAGCLKVLPRWVGPIEIEKPIGKVAYQFYIPER